MCLFLLKMRNQEDENIGIQNLSNNQNIDLNKLRIKNFSVRYKIVCSFLFYIISAYIIVTFAKKNEKNIININLSKQSLDIEKNQRNFFNKLKIILDKDEIFENEMMDKYTTFRIGGPAKFFHKAKNN